VGPYGKFHYDLDNFNSQKIIDGELKSRDKELIIQGKERSPDKKRRGQEGRKVD
jgi:hypothetical protein